MNLRRIKLSYPQIIIIGFLTVIMIGTLLLSLPISQQEGNWTSFLDSIFMATSATTVTGFLVVDTQQHWSIFGQIVILFLVQIGGLGFMMLVTLLFVLIRRKININTRQLVVQSAGLMQGVGVVRFVKRVIMGSLFVQLLGTVALSIRFVPEMGFWRGAWFALFHAVSAFCNAGFDLFRGDVSLTYYAGDPLVSLTIIILALAGSIGFIVWGDITRHRHDIRRYSLHSKIVLTTVGVLVLVGWLLLIFTEWNNSLQDLSAGNRVLAALFQSASSKTAGFGIVDTAQMSEGGRFLMMSLMFVGGSPGSTAGGIKTTTLAILVLNAYYAARKKRSIIIYKRKIEDNAVKQASAVFFMYVLLMIVATFAVVWIEQMPFNYTIFEIVAVISNAGLSIGVVSQVSVLSRLIFIVLMLVGRVGLFTLVIAMTKNPIDPPIDRLTEKVVVG